MKRLTFPAFVNPILIGAFVFIITALLSAGIAYQSYMVRKKEKQNQFLKEVTSINYNLKSAISNGLSATKTLAFIINRYGVPQDFESIAKSILESNKYIDALQLTEKGVITNVYPLKGNEAAIGFDVLRDSLSSREAIKAIQKRELYFAGPLELLQGGMAVVGRLPYFRDDKFEGFTVVIIKLSTLLKAAGISLQNKQFDYQLSKFDSATSTENFFLPEPIPSDTTKSISVSVPDGEWKLYVMQKGRQIPFDIIAFSFIGFIFSLTAALFTWHLTRQPERLKKLVSEKTMELVNAKNSIENSEARLTEAQKVAKIGSWETDLRTFNVIWSDEVFRIFGFQGKNLKITHEDFIQAVHPDDREKVEMAFRDSLNSQTSHSIEHRIVTPDGEIKHLEERWRIYQNENGLAVKAIGTCQDITKRLKAEEALKENEIKYKYLFENNPMPMLLWDYETLKIIDCNEETLIKYGYSREEFLNLTIKELRPPEDIPLLESHVQSKSNFGRIRKNVWRHMKKNGELMFVNISAHLINYEGKKVSLVMIDDVTEKLKAESEIISSYNQLQELTAHLQFVREEERTVIAREIHDELGQQLTALKMDATLISKKLNSDVNGVTEKLSDMIRLIDDTVKTIRRISSDLRPGILDDLGLIPALEWQGEEYAKRTGIKLQFHTNIFELHLDRNISTNIFRIFQEALTNIIRHSGATAVDISLQKEKDNLRLIVHDNGEGFESDMLQKRNSWGIIGMKERAAILKGELTIESENLNGTTITLKVPVN